jgi:tRNA-splicing ligase RtcB (3'-phosphate/5'-hydroxy nucleic acid ligase)
MISKNDFRKISDWLWEIPKDFRQDMRVPARVYASEESLEDSLRDKSIYQLINIATLPGIQKYSLAMPDVHQGYASPIGGVAAIKIPEGVISPGVCGFDINCGMRLLRTKQTLSEVEKYLNKIALNIQEKIPSGLGKGRKSGLSLDQIDKILEEGTYWLLEQGFGEKRDVFNCEETGKLSWADPSCVSSQAKKRGKDQVGTLGSGNHFLEIQKVEEIFNKEIANQFGLFENQITIMIHTGSRGLGHQVCTDYLRLMIPAMRKYKIRVPDKEFACVPFDSSEGQRYFSAMAAAANYAWSNRYMIAHYIREVWQGVFGKEEPVELLYDVAHNIIKKEKHIIEGKEVNVIVHRKGATRALPPEHPDLQEEYRSVGQPVLVPGSMGTASYILSGIEEGKQSWYSTCHGSGRVMSRRAAIKNISGDKVKKELADKGIIIKSFSNRGIAEEAPSAYKDIDKVIEVVCNAGLSKKVAKLVPLAVIKGE